MQHSKSFLQQFLLLILTVSIIDRCTAFQLLPRNSANIRVRRQAALDKIHELEKSVENWDSRDVGQCCNEFVRGK